MSVSIAMLKALREEGLDLDACIRVLSADDAPSTLEKRRAYDRERKREQREAERLSGGKSGGNPPDPAPYDKDILTPTLEPRISNEIPPLAENDDQPELKPEHVVEVWNENAASWGLKPIRKLTAGRRRKLLTRIRENSIDEFTEAISAIGRSSFLRGENGRGWRANFDWMLEPANFTKLSEGTYDR